MYKAISKHPHILDLYAGKLISEGVMTDQEYQVCMGQAWTGHPSERSSLVLSSTYTCQLCLTDWLLADIFLASTQHLATVKLVKDSTRFDFERFYQYYGRF